MNNLTKCVAALQDVRRSMQNDADPCTVAALDEAIAKLERCGTEEEDQAVPTVAEAALGALAIIGDILACLGGMAELVKFFGA
jgi:hypothetical protein